MRSGINPDHAVKLRLVLGRLDAATQVQEMNFHGSRLHRLKGDKKDLWSVTINGNWRMTFEFKDGDAYLVDYLDYH